MTFDYECGNCESTPCCCEPNETYWSNPYNLVQQRILEDRHYKAISKREVKSIL